jgi:hypothetical protein
MKGRLLAAAALCVFALGVSWSHNAGSAGYLVGGLAYTYHYDYASDGYISELEYQPGLYYQPGSGPTSFPGAGSDVRVLLVPAAAALVWASDPRRRHARTAARAAVAGLAFAVALGLSRGMPAAVLVTSAAIALAWPLTGISLRRFLGSPTAPVVARTGSG